MDILEIRNIPQDILKFVKLLQFKNEPIELLGSAGLKSQKYYADYDLFSGIQKYYKKSVVVSEFKKILNETNKNSNMYFIEMKIQKNNGDKIRFYNINDFKIDTKIKEINFIKLDYIIYVDNIFNELSIIYKFNKTVMNKDVLVKQLQEELNELIKDKNYFKAIKRIFSIIRIEDEPNKTELVNLTKFLNSDIGYLYKQNANLKAIKLLLENYNDNYTINKVINNLKDIKLQPNIKNIDKIIKNNDKIINAEALDFYKKFYKK